jgi:hypothetical protein
MRGDFSHPVPASNLPYFTDLFDSIGIICYSESINDPVIWSHYADCHRGLSFGFEFEPTDGLFKVEYPENEMRAQLDFDILTSLQQTSAEEAVLKVVQNGFTKKAKSWEYEREHRHFIRLSGCEMIGQHYFRQIPLASLRRIVIGVNSRITVSDIRRIKSLWKIPIECTITKARIDPRSYRIGVDHE